MNDHTTIRDIVRKIRDGELSASRLVAEYVSRAQEVNPSINAYLRLMPEQALKQARAIDERVASGGKIGPLAGVPIAIKDNMTMRGVEISAASNILQGYKPPFTATAIERLLEADAVVIGIANMDEFAMGSSTENSTFASTRNPRNPEYVPGGSSGGSAAAVAANIALGALGSDTGGSIRLPAAFCGVVGVKPTYGRVSRYGLIAYASSLDQIGTFGRTVEDAARMLDPICGFDPLDNTALPEPKPNILEGIDRDISGLRVGVPKELFGEGFDERIKRDVLTGIANLKMLGAEVREISLPTLDYALPCYYLIACAEASSNLQRFDGVRFGYRVAESDNLEDMMKATRSLGFGPEVQRRIILGTYILSAGYYDAYYLKAQKVRTMIIEDFRRAFDDVDIIAGPVSPVPPFRFGEKMDDPLAMYLTDVATVSANLAGLPALSMPCGDSANGLPTGIQLMARPMREDQLLNTAFVLEQGMDLDIEPFDIEPANLKSLEIKAKHDRVVIPVDRIAALACLRLDDGREQEFLKDLGEIVGYVDMLQELDTDSIPPTTHPVACRQHFKDDQPRDFEGRAEIISSAPKVAGTAFEIPNII